MKYNYEDEYLVSGIDDDELESVENLAISLVAKLDIKDELYVEKLVKAQVYLSLALTQLDNERMEAKYKAYKNEYNHYIALAKSNTSIKGSVSSISIARG